VVKDGRSEEIARRVHTQQSTVARRRRQEGA
jgi:DNA-binding MurR/RpiR family transcriptional regulator